MLVVEESVMEPEARQLVTDTCNIEVQEILSVHERAVFTSQPEAAGRVFVRKTVSAQ